MIWWRSKWDLTKGPARSPPTTSAASSVQGTASARRGDESRSCDGRSRGCRRRALDVSEVQQQGGVIGELIGPATPRAMASPGVPGPAQRGEQATVDERLVEPGAVVPVGRIPGVRPRV